MSIKAKIINSKNLNLENELKGLIKNKSLEVGFFEVSKYDNGVYVASVASFNEYGTAKIPPRPFFRNAVTKNSNKWNDILTNELRNSVDVELAYHRVGEVAKGDIVESIMQTNTPPNSPLTIAKKKSSKPLVDTSFMRSSVNYKVK